MPSPISCWHERLTGARLLGGLLIIVSAAAISYEPGHRHRFKLGIIAPILACTATLAASSVIFKFFAIKDAFWAVTFWNFAGEALFGAVMLAVPRCGATSSACSRKVPAR